MNELYEKDYNLWIEKQKQFLLNKDFDKLDIENLIEELEDMGSSDYRALESYLSVLLLHLLKLDYQNSTLKDPWIENTVVHLWKTSVNNSRRGTLKKLKKQPSLKSKIDEALIEAYEDAKEGAIEELNEYIRTDSYKLNDKSFPDLCPWKIEDLLTKGWLP